MSLIDFIWFIVIKDDKWSAIEDIVLLYNLSYVRILKVQEINNK